MHKSVDTEVSVIGNIAEVTAIGPILLARRTLGKQSLILKVPDELTRQTGIFLIEVEHFANITHRVAHGV